MSRLYVGKHDNDPEAILRAYEQLIHSPPEYVALDVETVSIVDRRVLGIAFATPDDNAFYFTIHDPSLPWHILWSDTIAKIWHNAPFDLSRTALGKYAVHVDTTEDTSLITRLLGIETELSQTPFYTGGLWSTWTVAETLAKYQAKDMSQVPWEAVGKKCCYDTLVTMDVWHWGRNRVRNQDYMRDVKYLRLLINMSYKGLRIDQSRLRAIDTELELELQYYLGLCTSLGFNPNSGDQVAYMLSDAGIFMPTGGYKRKNKWKPAITENNLRKVSHPIAQLTRISRKLGKLHSTYTHKWLAQDRIYTHFRQDASTARTKSDRDNLQNIPTGSKPDDYVPRAGKIRSVIIPDGVGEVYRGTDESLLGKQVWTDVDLSQIELRTFAELVRIYTGDVEMQYYLNYGLHNPDVPKNQWPDMHTETQLALRLQDRRLAKSFNFGNLFGGSDEVLAEHTRIDDIKLIHELQLAWKRRWPAAAITQEYLRKQALDTGMCETLSGRKLPIMGRPEQMTERHIGNCGVAYPVQGSAAEIFKDINLIILEQNQVPVELWALQVHDSDLWDGYVELPWEELAHTSSIYTPLEVKYAERWS